MTCEQLNTLKDCIDEVRQLAILTDGADSVDMGDLAAHMVKIYRRCTERREGR